MDNHPPLGYLLGNLSIRVFGVNPFAVRLPSMVGFGVAMLATYRVTARRAGQIAGLAALVLLLSSKALVYAVEARGYALVLGFAALALWSWQSAGDEDRSPWSLVGLCASAAAAIWTHYYAILLFVPLGIGELVKVWQRRKVDWALWIALALAALTFVPLYKLFIGRSAGFASHFWAAAASPMGIFEVLESLLHPMAIPLIGLAVVALVAHMRLRRVREAAVTVTAVFLVPALMWVMAKLVTHAFVYRYVLFTLVGASVATAIGAARFWAGSRVVRERCAAVLLAWLPISMLLTYKSLDTYGPTNRMIQFAQETAETLHADVVFDSNFDYLQNFYYGPEATRGRMFHLVDAESQLRFNEDDTMVHALAGLGQFTDIQVIDLTAFLRAHPRFAVISSVRFKDGWILPALVDKRATVTLVREEKPLLAYVVTVSDR
jgi:4-amino-4-deoxy-L-arabinose transferase-like glycosyltransferase